LRVVSNVSVRTEVKTDTSPDQFTFTDLTNVELDTIYSTAVKTVT
jgi:hypothetical protein